MQKVTGKRATARVERLHRYWLGLSRQHLAQQTPAASLPRAPEDQAGAPMGMKAAPDSSGDASSTAGHLPPPRHLIDPAAIVSLLPYVLLAEFETDPFRIRYRLTGTRIDDATGANLTGSYLDTIATGAGAAIFGPMIAHYRHAWQSGEPVIDYYHWTTQNGRVMPVCYGIFPLTIDGAIRQAIAIEEQAAEDDADPPRPKLRR